jgi:hypothetical protein
MEMQNKENHPYENPITSPADNNPNQLLRLTEGSLKQPAALKSFLKAFMSLLGSSSSI